MVIKMRTNSFNEQIGILIKNVLHEKADNYDASDEVKERIDKKIKERSSYGQESKIK